MINVAVCGSNGKMGKEVVRAVNEDSELNLVAQIDIVDGEYSSIENASKVQKIDVLVDFTQPKSIYENAQYCLNNEINIVIGTTGLSDEQIANLKSLSEKNIDEIIEARTFGFYRDLKKFQMLGFARGVNADNTLGLMDDGTYYSELRSEKEPIKHKILDLFGDFYLTGVSILDMKAQILVKEAGHAVHVKVANELKDKLIKI